MEETRINQLQRLREPFLANQISKLPKPTINNDEWKKLPKAKCNVCNGYHATSQTIHLDYVGHAALTDRLLEVDPFWFWEPMAFKDGLPAFDSSGGLWIRLVICGVSRIGYGNAASAGFRTIGDREKEVIGDALRNAAMRFGCALDLWHKGDLHGHDDGDEASKGNKDKVAGKPPLKKPQAQSEKQTIRDELKITGVTINAKNNKRFQVLDSANTTYYTFSQSLAEKAKKAKTDNSIVANIMFEESKYGKELKSFDVVGEVEPDLIPPGLQPTLDLEEEKDRVLDLLRGFAPDSAGVEDMCTEAIGKTPNMEWDTEDIGRMDAYIKLQEEVRKAKDGVL